MVGDIHDQPQVATRPSHLRPNVLYIYIYELSLFCGHDITRLCVIKNMILKLHKY